MRVLFTTIFLCFLFYGSATSQHPLTGTWQLLSAKGTDADGNPFAIDTTTVHEVKIITPTHYMLIAHDIEGDSLVFNRTYAGKVETKGDQYIETPLMSSLQIVDNVKTQFSWRVDGDRFTQSGSVIRPDGRTVNVVLVFRRITSAPAWPQNPALGTWRILSTTVTTPDGKTRVEKAPEVEVMEIITPTHWMGISYRNSRFENALGGTYTMKGNQMIPTTLYSALPMKKDRPVVLDLDRSGNKLTIRGSSTSRLGTSTWTDTCEKMD